MHREMDRQVIEGYYPEHVYSIFIYVCHQQSRPIPFV